MWRHVYLAFCKNHRTCLFIIKNIATTLLLPNHNQNLQACIYRSSGWSDCHCGAVLLTLSMVHNITGVESISANNPFILRELMYSEYLVQMVYFNNVAYFWPPTTDVVQSSHVAVLYSESNFNFHYSKVSRNTPGFFGRQGASSSRHVYFITHQAHNRH